MPIYEFLCNSCQNKTSLFVKSISEPFSPACSACGSKDLTRLISSFTYRRSLKSIHEQSGEPDKPRADYYQDPRNIGRWTEKRFKELGVEMPSQVQEMIEAAREGELPHSVKELQPGLSEV